MADTLKLNKLIKKEIRLSVNKLYEEFTEVRIKKVVTHIVIDFIKDYAITIENNRRYVKSIARRLKESKRY